MSQQSLTPPTQIEYYSAHRGPVFGADGEFHHFARQCDSVHTRNGYWRFSTYSDDRRAYDCGLDTPETVLIAQDVGDGTYNNIMLCWVPGNLDKSSKPSVGTAAAHLETIYNERKLLGKSLSFRGRVPLYSISTDQSLINYRLTRYGIQKGVLPDTTLLSPTRDSSLKNKMATNSTPAESPSCPPRWASASLSTPAPLRSSLLAGSPPVTSDRSIQNRAAIPYSGTLVQPTPLTPIRESVKSNDHLESTRCLQTSPPSHHSYFKALLPDSEICERIPFGSTSAFKGTHISVSLPISKPDGLEESHSMHDKGDACYMHGSHGTAGNPTDDFSTLSFENLAFSELFDAKSAALPCMDCGSVGSHASHCWINEATLRLQPTNELAISKLCELAEQVTRFDPGPWTTHIGPPQESVDSAKTQIQGIAEIIRNLDTSAEHPELNMFDDQVTVLLWGLQSSGNVQILKAAYLNSTIAFADQDDDEIQDAW